MSRVKMRKREETVLLTLLVLGSIYAGVYWVYPHFDGVPDHPERLVFKLRYGVGAKNILDSENGTYTKDMILDPAITINLVLSERELDLIWKSIIDNDFYNLTDQNAARASSVSPVYDYTLTVSADGYPEKTVRMADIWQGYTEDELRFFRITRTILDIVESKPVYKALPKPRGGYA